MPDTTRKLWLLEVNKCPTMEYSTHVTRVLVPRFLEDLADLMLHKKPRPVQIKGFERIYESPFIDSVPPTVEKRKLFEVVGTQIPMKRRENGV